jgi:hypothetical protein
MEVKKLVYIEKENINKLVKCLEKDKIYLRNIPHQPGEFSAKPFKLTKTCMPNRKGDYYQYYKGCKQLPTFEKNIKTPFTNIKIIKHKCVKLKRKKKTPLSIHCQYDIIPSKEKYNFRKAFCFILKGGPTWGEFIQDWLPYLFFCKDLLEKDSSIKIITKEIGFDSYNFILKKILKLNNETIFIKKKQNLIIDELYEFKINGPFASGLFPYQGHCTCPIILYKNMFQFIQENYLKNKFKKQNILIYTRRNNGDTTTRMVKNEMILENYLKDYCKLNNLKYISFFYKNYSFEDRIKLFNSAKIIVGCHGSANFHTLFCNKNIKIIEFIFVKDCHSTQLVNLSYGLEYWQIPVPEYGQFEKKVKISEKSIESLKQILNN